MKKVYLAECVKAHTQTVKMESLVVCAESGIQKLDSGYEVENKRETGQVFRFSSKKRRDEFVKANNFAQGGIVMIAKGV